MPQALLLLHTRCGRLRLQLPLSDTAGRPCTVVAAFALVFISGGRNNGFQHPEKNNLGYPKSTLPNHTTQSFPFDQIVDHVDPWDRSLIFERSELVIATPTRDGHPCRGSLVWFSCFNGFRLFFRAWHYPDPNIGIKIEALQALRNSKWPQ